MKLVLKNFCCWENKIFIFPDKGNVLLSAPSGSGKTSIIRAIIFAFFGTGQKIVQHGKRTCSVELQVDDLHIIRTKGPGRLIVNNVHEDDEAQALINKYVYNDMIHVSQDMTHNFVMMNPNDKLQVLEKIIFNNIDIHSVKTGIRDKIKECENKILVKTTELDSATDLLNEMKCSDPIKLPNHLVYTKNITSIKQCEYEKAKKAYDIVHSLLNTIHTETVLYEQTLNDIRECESHMSDESSIKGELSNVQEKVRVLKQQEQYTRVKNDFQQQQDIYNTSIRQEKQDLEVKIKRVEDEIRALPFSSTQDAKQQMSTFKQQINYHNEWTDLHSRLDTIHINDDIDSIQTELAKKGAALSEVQRTLHDTKSLYSCPECTITLKMVNNTLVKEGKYDISQIDAQTLHATIKQTQQDLRQLEQRKTNLLMLTDQKNQLGKRIQSIQPKLPEDIQECKKQLARCEKQYDEFVSKQSILKSYNSQLEHCVQKYNQIKTHLVKLEQQYQTLKTTVRSPEASELARRSEYEQTIVRLQQQLSLNQHHAQQAQRLKDKLIHHQTKMNTLREQCKQYPSVSKQELEEYRTDIELLQKYSVYYNAIQLEEKYIQKQATLLKEIKEQEEVFLTTSRFREMISEAENIALSNLICTINNTVQIYLDSFFDKEPMYATLSCFKEVKQTKKSQINISITHKGNSVDLSSLSGGERDRLILAFSLTFSDIINSPLLLLDECVSSLDQENAEIVFDCIKDHQKDKLVILVAHQIITGMFDETILLD